MEVTAVLATVVYPDGTARVGDVPTRQAHDQHTDGSNCDLMIIDHDAIADIIRRTPARNIDAEN